MIGGKKAGCDSNLDKLVLLFLCVRMYSFKNAGSNLGLTVSDGDFIRLVHLCELSLISQKTEMFCHLRNMMKAIVLVCSLYIEMILNKEVNLYLYNNTACFICQRQYLISHKFTLLII